MLKIFEDLNCEEEENVTRYLGELMSGDTLVIDGINYEFETVDGVIHVSMYGESDEVEEVEKCVENEVSKSLKEEFNIRNMVQKCIERDIKNIGKNGFTDSLMVIKHYKKITKDEIISEYEESCDILNTINTITGKQQTFFTVVKTWEETPEETIAYLKYKGYGEVIRLCEEYFICYGKKGDLFDECDIKIIMCNY